MIELGPRIRYFRSRQGLTQDVLARRAKLTPKFVSQIENGRVNPSIGVLERLVGDGLGLSLGVFFTWDPDSVDVSQLLARLVQQPADVQRRVARVVEILCDGEQAEPHGKRRDQAERAPPAATSRKSPAARIDARRRRVR